ncbi:MAG: hypothetical protein OXC95_18415 [Dehalococcoidia bacterium]|nr:hypothetical protein [Dehalococcoidia bacterium]
MNGREDLKAKIDGLSDSAIRFVTRMVDSLSSPPASTIKDPDAWISRTDEWIEYFGLALSVHHGTTKDALGLNGFETAFCNACESVGWEIERAESATHRFSDLTVKDRRGKRRRLSLKSTAAQKISPKTAHISKLTEAAWIQDTRSASTRREKTLALFREYTDAVDSIIMLRAFRKKNEMPNRYQLVEIPTEMFDSLQNTSAAQFSSDGPRVFCSYKDNEQAAQISLDRSDAKITVSRISLGVCTIHAEWELT